MTRVLHLARRYLTRYWVRSLLLVLCMALAFLLPIAVNLLVGKYAERLRARAESTPFVAGARGSRYDLVLSSLYFRGRVPGRTNMAELDRVEKDDLGIAVPLHAGLTAKSHPVVGTTADYYAQRGLRAQVGTLPLLIGDATLGIEIAEALGAGPGDTVLTDKEGLYQFGMAYPLRLNIVGILERTDGPDDRAIFTDIKSVWIAEGIGHGHDEATAQDPARVLSKEDGIVRLDSGVMTFTKIDAGNLGTFHFHGTAAEMPVTGILVWPRPRDRERVKLLGRYSVSKTSQLLKPTEVIDEVLGFVFAIKRFFDANALLVTLSTALFLVLVIWLSLRVRRDEMDTYAKIGASRGFVVSLIATELGLLVLAALALAAACGWVISRVLAHWIGV